MTFVDRACRLLFALCVSGVSVSALANTAADRAGCQDHPAISRYEGSVLFDCKTEAFGEYLLLVKPVTAERLNDSRKTADNTQKLEGRLTRLRYDGPKDRSALEVARNIQAALTSAGAEIVFQCALESCGARNGGNLTMALAGRDGQETRYAAARFKRAQGDIYVAALVTGRDPPARVLYEIVEVKAMQTGLVTIDAAAMQRSLASEGRQTLYGITFDFNAATLKAESQPQLDEISKLLKAQEQLAVYVVGHTDNVGSLETNLELSQRRAQAVVAALLKGGVAPARLTPKGVAQLAPVAPNSSEEGRAKNRRVEIVVR
jgi:OmpA-OmpF porin, OOP family